MSYCFSTTLEAPFEAVISRVEAALKDEGFGILTDIDVSAALAEKLDVEFRNYRILGACNPPFAYEALRVEDKIGAMLPCNVVVQEAGNGRVEVAAVDPAASMQAIDNPRLSEVAEKVRAKLRRVVERL
jgi:uncharacterized protein (DUF302 family)